MKRIIIGVIGKSDVDETNSAARKLLRSARQIGQLIADEGHIVLTGGHHKKDEASVKHHAIRGAFDFEHREKRAGIIGIPPDRFSSGLNFTQRDLEAGESVDGRLQWLYIHTLYCSELRNPLNGNTPDILIALYGGKGTIQEMEEGINAGRTVVVLNPSTEQREFISSHKASVLEVSSEIEAVKNAIEHAGSGEFPERYRDLPDDFCLDIRSRIKSLRGWVAENAGA